MGNQCPNFDFCAKEIEIAKVSSKVQYSFKALCNLGPEKNVVAFENIDRCDKTNCPLEIQKSVAPKFHLIFLKIRLKGF